ncbi:MAG TPA: hypothetical protein VMC03_11710 [Streptosporangiaceae bacterium]|nr:hypothetical protein [Streptosporangiaceae bacterium]
MSPHPPPGAPGVAPRSRAWRAPAFVIGVVALAAVASVALSAATGSTGPGQGARTSAVSVTAGSVSAVDLQDVPGQLTIVTSATGRVTLTGRLDWAGRGAAAGTQSRSGRLLRLSYRCAAASPCTADLRLTVPRRTAITLRQPSGHVVMSGLAGPLRISASSVDIMATGLRCPSLDAAITSGHLGAWFGGAPRQVNISLTSAQATLWLPGGAPYAVTDQVTSGFIHVGVPQASGAPRSLTARITSGELDLQTR